MPELLRWPFALPDHFLDALGYARTVVACESPAMRARITELLRRQGIDAALTPPTGPRRFVLLYWECAGDELAFSDGVHSGAGQLDYWVWLDHVRGHPRIYGWLFEHRLDLGSSEAPASHALVLDGHTGEAWVAPMPTARAIVRRQRLEVPIDT